jgi:hypothetical protein
MKTLNQLIGRKIVCIRPISDKEKELESWDGSGCTSVIELDDGTLIYPSSDDEGNSGGTLFGKGKDGSTFYVWSKEEVR